MDRQLVIDAIANLLLSRGIKTRNVVAAVSGRAVIVKKITMNRLSNEDAQQRSTGRRSSTSPTTSTTSRSTSRSSTRAERPQADASPAGRGQEGHGRVGAI